MTKATLVEVSVGVATEEACRTLCCSTPACNHYSYFTSDSAVLSETCVLLSKCTGRRMDLSVRSATPTCPAGAQATLPAGVRTYRPVEPNPACSGYHVLDSVTRNVGTRRDAAVVKSACGDYCIDHRGHPTISPDWRGGGWYRYQGEAGTQIPTYPPGYGQCGAYRPGWMEGEHPTVGQGEVSRTVYFQGLRSTKEFSTTVKVVNCGQFYVYHLPDTPGPHGNLAYCGV